ncbi:prm10p [Lichtheimia corymbifera JMRC:FSU:9682]|uniref:Prm10p n=1 Tax=Lichtheimia corymbifera JMRC:FSU:9682 TaxID=1263082 RepID=A0A068S657_9FUNG|nr:prm10p [Lichtheimia corymbifera JMRC:FSU:9682]
MNNIPKLSVPSTDGSASTTEDEDNDTNYDTDATMDETPPPRRSSSADTLVNAAIKSHQEAEGHHRHGGFNRQLSESLGLIQGILNGRRLSHHPLHGSRPSNAGFEALHDKGPCHDHLEKSDEEHSSNGININHRGSVLGSLLQLESHLAQRRSSTRSQKRKSKRRQGSVKRDRGGTPLAELAKKNKSSPNLSSRQWLYHVTSSDHVVPSLNKRRKKRPGTSRANSINSQASQFEPITVADRVRIAFEIANILQRQSFLYRLSKALMHYGCPAHRLEYILKQVSDTLNVDAEFVYIPNIMMINFFDPGTHTTETHFIRQSLLFDMHKLGEVFRLEKLVAHGEVTVDEALEFLDKVSEDPQFYPSWLNPVIYAVISLCGCVMFFGGRWKEAGLSAGLATSTRFGFCFIPTAFASFIVILPGYVIAIAIIELVSRQLVSGVVRMVYAIIYSFLLGYGISMGSSLYVTVDRHTSTEAAPYCQVTANANTCIVAESQYYLFLTVPVFALAYCILLRNRPARWPVVIFISIVGFCMNWLFSCVVDAPQQIIQVVPAFVVGLLGNLLTKLTARMSFDAVLVAIFYLVPGSLGLKAAIGLFGGNQNEYMSQGGSFALSMIEASIGIALGLCIANLLVYPKGAQHTPLMNF